MEYDKLELIEHKAEKLLQTMKSSNESANYTNALYVMIALFLISLCFLYIKSGEHILVYAIALVIALVVYRFMLRSAMNDVDSSLNYKSYDSSDKTLYVLGMLKFLAANINLQLSRIKALRTVYMLVFPFFLMMIRQIYSGPILKSDYFFNLIVALILGVGFWYFFFKKQVDEKELDYWEVNNLSKTINS